jgi:hypothetical protein
MVYYRAISTSSRCHLGLVLLAPSVCVIIGLREGELCPKIRRAVILPTARVGLKKHSAVSRAFGPCSTSICDACPVVHFT